jgi:hypothetical protein
VHYSNAKFNNNAMRCNTPGPDALNEAFNKCEELIPYFMATKWENEESRETFLVISQGIEYMISMLISMQSGEKCGVILNDVEVWLKDYSKLYLKESKEGELRDFVKVMYELALKYLA